MLRSRRRRRRKKKKKEQEEERNNPVLSDSEKQAADISNDIKKMKQQVDQMIKLIETMDRSFVDIILAESNSDLSLVRKGNKLKMKCNETDDARSLIEKQIVDLT